jgi:pSer/pThr/pTyr-binding forkhead associated (FHA) protein
MDSETVIMRRTPPDFAYLIVASGHRIGKAFRLEKETTIGRAVENDVCIDDSLASSRHAKVVEKDGTYTIFDLATENGTKVNGEIIHSRPLWSDDRISIGETTLAFKHLKILPERQIGDQHSD